VIAAVISMCSTGRASVADAHRSDGKRYVVCADEKLTAFVELERVMRRRNVFNLEGIEQQIAIAGAAF